jgi:GNAT superfamily N-acetyltransferase
VDAARGEPYWSQFQRAVGANAFAHGVMIRGMTDPAELLAAYDALRAHVPDRLPAGASVERDGPVLRFLGFVGRGFVLYSDLGGLEGAALDELIERQIRVFAERGEAFEWKLAGHDRPADLPERLRAAGFVPEEQETVVIASTAEIAVPPVLPAGVMLREVTSRADLERIAAMEEAVWGADHGWLATSLEGEREADPEGLTVVVAEAGGEVVCAAWIRFERGTDFGTLWGGATLPAWRRRGIYRATVAYRAGLAAERGFRYLEVDASDDSRPILERLGFGAVTTTTPYVWSPPGRTS